MDRVIDALRRSLEVDPTDHPVRIHLAELLLAADDAASALKELTFVLAADPANTAALRLAADAAHAAGDSERGTAYGRLADALAPGPEHSTMEAAPEGGELGATVPDTADELLQDWSNSEPVTEPELGSLAPAGVTLADVGGLDDVKRRLDMSFLAPMRNPDLTQQFGKSLRGGLLLWGPPGCGKTFVARALAGELGANFYEVGLSEVLDMYVGNSERNVSSIFEAARRNQPCLIFFDEIDALGQKRAGLRHGGAAMRGVVNQLLVELDGATSDNKGVFVLAASNHPWDIDTALLRPGRFDRSILVLPPDREARQAIVGFHLRGRPTDNVDLRSVAKATEGFSGADLALACEQAIELAMERSLASGELQPITQQQLMNAAKQIRPSIGDWMEMAKSYALYGNQGGTYDELAAYLRRRGRR